MIQNCNFFTYVVGRQNPINLLVQVAWVNFWSRKVYDTKFLNWISKRNVPTHAIKIIFHENGFLKIRWYYFVGFLSCGLSRKCRCITTSCLELSFLIVTTGCPFCFVHVSIILFKSGRKKRWFWLKFYLKIEPIILNFKTKLFLILLLWSFPKIFLVPHVHIYICI